ATLQTSAYAHAASPPAEPADTSAPLNFEDPPTLHTMECQACGQASVDSTDPTDGTRWAADHFKAHRGHLTYQEHIERSYRFEPGAWQ
ncbi:hypothetical protein, partial [Streptomyces sp. NPDC056160]|uniref:DUF7848 domain-containing protein n=1 Tax=Streptomyces sp. NPDC056160 TaxID=3345731 RepID=UPI0035E19333